MTVKPAAGPDTHNCEPLKKETNSPHTSPAINPENNGAPDANAIPKQRGNATRNTTNEADMSPLKFEA